MEKLQKNDKNVQIGAILYAFNYLKAKKIVKTQKDFAKLLDVTEQTISCAMNGKGRSSNDTFVARLANFMQENYNIDIMSPASQIFVTGDAVAAPEAPADTSIHLNENVSRMLDLLDEKDKQINRLLTLLENEQKARKEVQ